MSEKNQETENKLEKNKNQVFRVGMGVMIILAVLTIGEYWLGSIAVGWWAPLMLIGILKAYFVVRDYMHLPRLFAGEEEEVH